MKCLDNAFGSLWCVLKDRKCLCFGTELENAHDSLCWELGIPMWFLNHCQPAWKEHCFPQLHMGKVSEEIAWTLEQMTLSCTVKFRKYWKSLIQCYFWVWERKASNCIVRWDGDTEQGWQISKRVSDSRSYLGICSVIAVFLRHLELQQRRLFH